MFIMMGIPARLHVLWKYISIDIIIYNCKTIKRVFLCCFESFDYKNTRASNAGNYEL